MKVNNYKKNEESNKNEKIVVSLMLLILLAFIGYVFYSAFNSNRLLETNETSGGTYSNGNGTNINTKTNGKIIGIYDDEINKKVETQLSTFTTHIYDRDKNRVHNITLAISKLNGAIIKAGDEFSFNNTIGPMGADQGYKEAVGFDSNGRNIPSFGGGICQISSTIYNLALLSNLEVTERHPHSKRVYYVPINKDATVYYGSLDLKFINNTGKDIKIVATNNNTDVTITFMSIS